MPGISTPDFFAGASSLAPQQTKQRRLQLREDFSSRKENWGGDHNIKVGAEVLASHYGGLFVPNLYGSFNFSRSLGNDLNSYLNGIADTFVGSAGNKTIDDTWTYVAAYIQDDWKVNPRLTLNLGLRYEIQYGPYSNKFDTPGIRTLQSLGYPTQKKPDLNNIGPRVGLAWDVNGHRKLVVRGGYGRYYDEIFQNITFLESWSQINRPTNFISLSPAPFTPNQYAANRDSIRNSLIDPTFAGQPIRLTAHDLQQPYADQFNVGLSAQATRHLAFDLDYVHTTGRDEIARWLIDTVQNVSTRLSPGGIFDSLRGPYNVEGNRGHSNFDGVYLTTKLRTAKHLLVASYAWSKANNLANDFNSPAADITNANWEIDWGPTPNDVRHRVTGAGVFDLGAGFQISTSLQANTGRPVNAFAGLGGIRGAVRAIDPATGQMYPRNSFRAGPETICPDGPGTPTCQQGGTGGLAFLSWDARLSKFFKLGNQSRGIELLAEVFNITNHPNFDTDSYISTYTSSSFGTATAVLRNSQREAEFGMRFRF
jgi:hypothetical protein